MFERDGFLDTRLVDITTEAGAGVGTFYRHFSGKEEIFEAVLDVYQELVLTDGLNAADLDTTPPTEILESALRAYFSRAEQHARIFELYHEAIAVNPASRGARLRNTLTYRKTTAEFIRELQRRGMTDPALDPEDVARSFFVMINRLAFTTFCLRGEGDEATVESLVGSCTQLWSNLLRLPGDSPVTPR